MLMPAPYNTESVNLVCTVQCIGSGGILFALCELESQRPSKAEPINLQSTLEGIESKIWPLQLLH